MFHTGLQWAVLMNGQNNLGNTLSLLVFVAVQSGQGKKVGKILITSESGLHALR